MRTLASTFTARLVLITTSFLLSAALSSVRAQAADCDGFESLTRVFTFESGGNAEDFAAIRLARAHAYLPNVIRTPFTLEIWDGGKEHSLIPKDSIRLVLSRMTPQGRLTSIRDPEKPSLTILSGGGTFVTFAMLSDAGMGSDGRRAYLLWRDRESLTKCFWWTEAAYRNTPQRDFLVTLPGRDIENCIAAGLLVHLGSAAAACASPLLRSTHPGRHTPSQIFRCADKVLRKAANETTIVNKTMTDAEAEATTAEQLGEIRRCLGEAR